MYRSSLRAKTAVSSAALVALGALVAGGLTAMPAAAAPSPEKKPVAKSELGSKDRQLLAKARRDGERTVTMLVAADRGQNDAVINRLTDLGATVSKREDSLDYVRVQVPISKVEKAAKVDGLTAADLDEVIPLEDPRPGGETGGNGTVDPTPYPAPGAATPQSNPYMPIADTKAAQFQQANPKFDGRGTTIGILDSGVDLGNSALQTTTTGERKVTDWVTYTDPARDAAGNNLDGDPTWVYMDDQVSGPTFTFKGATYSAPAGAYRVGLFNERAPNLGGEVGNDVNRDGNPAGSVGTFAVLWDTTSNTVRVDANQNKNFSDDKAMSDYRTNFDVGAFGTDNPGTAIVESMPFVVQPDKANNAVNIGIVSGAHGSHVAGITAANKMFGGAMTGAAPGAKIKSVRVCLFVAGCTAHALVEGMIYVAQQKVDVINMSIGGLPALNDGNNTRAVLYDRLIDQYKVQMFISAGNSGAGLNTIGDPSVATKVMSVGSYITNETWKSNYGSSTVQNDNMHPFSSRGPREDGGFKPQIIAPGSAVSTVPTWQSPAGACLPHNCPVGYAMFNGTSMASPQAAGAAAALLSAAKQSRVDVEPERLRKVFNSTARFIGNYGAHAQGNGLIDVPAAWNMLKAGVKKDDTITSSVPVNTVLSGFLATPGQGQGIYDREGVKAGDSYTREYTFTRTSGGSKATYNLSWVGNDGTFSSATTISLPRGTAVKLPVSVTPATSGIHSAILNLDDPKTRGVDYQTMNTVVAADQFSVANNFAVTKSGTIARNQAKSFFYAVPAGTPAFKVDIQGGGTTPGAGQIRFLRFHPYGVGIDVNSTPNYYNPPACTPSSAATCNVGQAQSRTVTNPLAGVWEVVVEARRTSDTLEAPFSLTASILGATISPNPDVIASATAGVPVSRSYTLTNKFGAFTGRAVGGGSLGSAKRGQESIANLAQKTHPLQVTAGSSSLRATIGNTSDTAADLDLFVYNCTASGANPETLAGCTLAGQSADGDSEESVTIASPAAGAWSVLVDGFAVPAGTTTYDYVDVFVNSAFGSVSVTDSNALRPAGATWTVPGTVIANAAPAAGRVLLGGVQVRTDANVLVGSSDVVVQQVQ